MPRSTNNSSMKNAKFKPGHRDNDMSKDLEKQNFVFIKVKDRHQYDLNPKVLKFFLHEMLKDEKNRNKLGMINQKLGCIAGDKVMKFGMQQYFNVMDEIVNMLEDTLEREDHATHSFTKSSIFNERLETKVNYKELKLPSAKKLIPEKNRFNRSAVKLKNRTKPTNFKSGKNTVSFLFHSNIGLYSKKSQ